MYHRRLRLDASITPAKEQIPGSTSKQMVFLATGRTQTVAAAATERLAALAAAPNSVSNPTAGQPTVRVQRYRLFRAGSYAEAARDTVIRIEVDAAGLLFHDDLQCTRGTDRRADLMALTARRRDGYVRLMGRGQRCTQLLRGNDQAPVGGHGMLPDRRFASRPTVGR